MTQNTFSQIMILTDNLFNVIEVEGQYWIVQEFEPSINDGKLSSVSYNCFSGICITEFLETQKIQFADKAGQLSFLQQINKFVENKVYVKVKFSQYARYFLYTKN